jgi:hypothetical protein
MIVHQFQKSKKHKYTACNTRRGHTIIDVLIARAGVLCVLGLDYQPTIALARKLAALSERRAA